MNKGWYLGLQVAVAHALAVAVAEAVAQLPHVKTRLFLVKPPLPCNFVEQFLAVNLNVSNT